MGPSENQEGSAGEPSIHENPPGEIPGGPERGIFFENTGAPARLTVLQSPSENFFSRNFEACFLPSPPRWLLVVPERLERPTLRFVV